MSALADEGRALLEATQRLERLLEGALVGSLDEAFDARERAFVAFAAACEGLGEGPDSAGNRARAREVARRVLGSDARIVELARTRLDHVRADLDGLGARRRAREAGRRAMSEPRFLSRRV